MRTGTDSSRVAFGLTAITMALTLAVPATAADVLDQSNEVTAGIAAARITNNYWAQTFTAGVDGTMSLLELDLAQNGDPAAGDLVVEVRTVVGGVPSEDVLASATVTSTEIPDDFGWVQVPVSVSQLAGQQFAIVLTAPDAGSDCGGAGCGYRWHFNVDAYAGGAFQFSQTGNSWMDAGSLDTGFRTYVFSADEEPTLDSLGDDVAALGLARKDANSLFRPLAGAQKHLDAGRLNQGCAKIDQFADRVASMSGDEIDPADAEALIDDAAAVKADLGCPA